MSAAVIPYESQVDAQTSRMCGAASLSMVYRSLGLEIPQIDFWPGISKPDRFGNLAAMTHLMAQDAINKGYRAVAFQARHPLQALRLCREWGIHAILNHRLRREASAGHYSVLVDIDDNTVLLHDPLYGPLRRLSHSQLLELWQPHFHDSEILGNVLIGISAAPPAPFECEFCHTQTPAQVDCPRCKRPVFLAPAALFGCMRDGCIARMWNYLCCPACECMWTFSLEGPLSVNHLPAPAPAKPDDPWKLDQLFAVLDKFNQFIVTLSAAASLPELQPQLDFIRESKQTLKLAQAEEFARLKAQQDKLGAMQEAAQQKEAIRRQKIEERNQPLPPLDANTLARQLLLSLELPL